MGQAIKVVENKKRTKTLEKETIAPLRRVLISEPTVIIHKYGVIRNGRHCLETIECRFSLTATFYAPFKARTSCRTVYKGRKNGKRRGKFNYFKYGETGSAHAEC